MQEAAAFCQLGRADPSPHLLWPLPSTGSDYSRQHQGPPQLVVVPLLTLGCWSVSSVCNSKHRYLFLDGALGLDMLTSIDPHGDSVSLRWPQMLTQPPD